MPKYAPRLIGVPVLSAPKEVSQDSRCTLCVQDFIPVHTPGVSGLGAIPTPVVEHAECTDRVS